LGELTRIAGLLVPPGFCVTTRAYRKFISSSHELSRLLDALDSLKADAVEALQQLGEQIRTHLLSLPMPEEISAEILQAWQETGSHEAYAVRSSATAEDLPGASFAGQQDTFLNMRELEQILNAVLHCWASLFTDRAIVYRRQNGYSHRKVQLAVVIQQMIFSEVSGIMFTADPVSGNRRITSIDAGFGLGEALVSGQVSADLYQVKTKN
jgi:phosphoenolpyruvate synthase (EC 2.7.9.2)